jgi:hypothetical protein
MRQARHRSPSPAMVVALLALFIALGGTPYATLQSGGDQQATASQDTTTIARSTFKDSFTLSTAANQFVQVARLKVPAGRYVVVAKLFTGPPQQGTNDHVRCELSAGVDFDRVVVNHDAITAFTSMSLNVVHRFSSPGTVRLRCGHVFTASTTSLGFIKITAIRVRALSNVPSP